MANKIRKQTVGAPENQILIAEDSYKVTISATILDTDIVANEEGRKIVKAGSPLNGRATGSKEFSVTDTNCNAVLLHDVDVTEGPENGTVVLAGVVDLAKLDASVITLLTGQVQSDLITKNIIFINSNN